MEAKNNIQNGGLICKEASTLIVGQVAKGKGMTYLQVVGDFTQEEVMPWFMNLSQDEQYVYYSNALADNFLCQMNLETQLSEVLLKEPIYLLQLEGKTLYWIQESNHHIYSYDLLVKESKKVIDEEVMTFNLVNGDIWYATKQGIFKCDSKGIGSKKYHPQGAYKLVCNDEEVAWIDYTKEHQVAYMNQSGGEVSYIDNSKSTSIQCYRNYIFYNQAQDRGHLYRYDIKNGLDIKFVPEQVDYLHIIGDTLYYFNLDERVWKKVPVQGGKSSPIMTEEGSIGYGG